MTTSRNIGKGAKAASQAANAAKGASSTGGNFFANMGASIGGFFVSAMAFVSSHWMIIAGVGLLLAVGVAAYMYSGTDNEKGADNEGTSKPAKSGEVSGQQRDPSNAASMSNGPTVNKGDSHQQTLSAGPVSSQ